MKSIKQFFVALVILSLSVPALADDFINSVLGAAIGGAAGSKIGNGNGRKAAIVAGALGGAFLGGNADQSTERRHRETLQNQSDNTTRMMDSHQNNGYRSNVQETTYIQPTRMVSQYVEQPSRTVVEYVEPVVERRVRQAPQQQQGNGCGNEEYYDGQYNPEAAQAFCRGMVERKKAEQARRRTQQDQVVRDAYNAGLTGN